MLVFSSVETHYCFKGEWWESKRHMYKSIVQMSFLPFQWCPACSGLSHHRPCVSETQRYYVFFPISEFTITKCGLKCRQKRHFHCCYCAAMVIDRAHFLLHLKQHEDARSPHAVSGAARNEALKKDPVLEATGQPTEVSLLCSMWKTQLIVTPFKSETRFYKMSVVLKLFNVKEPRIICISLSTPIWNYVVLVNPQNSFSERIYIPKFRFTNGRSTSS